MVKSHVIFILIGLLGTATCFAETVTDSTSCTDPKFKNLISQVEKKIGIYSKAVTTSTPYVNEQESLASHQALRTYVPLGVSAAGAVSAAFLEIPAIASAVRATGEAISDLPGIERAELLTGLGAIAGGGVLFMQVQDGIYTANHAGDLPPQDTQSTASSKVSPTEQEIQHVMMRDENEIAAMEATHADALKQQQRPTEAWDLDPGIKETGAAKEVVKWAQKSQEAKQNYVTDLTSIDQELIQGCTASQALAKNSLTGKTTTALERNKDLDPETAVAESGDSSPTHVSRVGTK